MTSSVERKQYEWKHEEDRSFISKESVTGNRDMEQLSEGTRLKKKRFWKNMSTICSYLLRKLITKYLHLPTISKTAVLVSESSLYKEAIFKSTSAALWGSNGSTWLKQERLFDQ